MTTTKTRPRSVTLQLAAAVEEEVTSSTQERQITGLAVPFGPVGYSSLGPITFAAGSITWAEQIGRVKLLEQHDPDRVVGFATAIEQTDEGLRATFTVADGPEGDKALAMVADGRRDGLSVGVMLSDESLEEVFEKWWEGDTSPTAVTGGLLEVSLVTLPAFDDARSDGSAAAALGDNPRHLTLSVPTWASGATPKENRMPTATATAAQPEAQAAGTTDHTTEPQPGPAPRAAAGAALEVHEAPVYTFDGRGPSFVRDMYRLRFGDLDEDGRHRVQRFNEAWGKGDAGQVDAFMRAAVETRSTENKGISTDVYRPDLLIQAIDKGRPLVSRIGTVRIDDATPFRIPVEGEFTGVGDHVEGTAHVAEGDLTMDDEVVTPGAISGAYRLSRELIDAYNPALDQIASRAMVRDYRRKTEAKTSTALAAGLTPEVGINTVQELRLKLNEYTDIDDLPADLVAMGTTFYSALLADVDGTGRPMLPFIGAMNAVGTVNRAGYTGASIDDTELVKVSSMKAALADDAIAFQTDAMFLGESPLQTFRFEEVEGPGVIKLALWAYFVAAKTRPAAVKRYTSAAS